MADNTPTYVIGDIHGQFRQFVRLLRRAGLINDDLSWVGGKMVLWLLGDFVDRGPDGIGVIDLVMRLQAEAAAVGGHVGALLGNHEALLLAVHRFGGPEGGATGRFFRDTWRRNGGQSADMARLTARHIDWLAAMPALALEQEWLLMHADSSFYEDYGASVDVVNEKIGGVLRGADAGAWMTLLDGFFEREAFSDRDVDGSMYVGQFLRRFGGHLIVHGHTPISIVDDLPPEAVTAPLVYADGACLNVDGGMYMGGPGFVYELTSHRVAMARAKQPAQRQLAVAAPRPTGVSRQYHLNWADGF